MVNRIALLSVSAAALAAAFVPRAATAADYYDEGRGSVVMHSRQDVEIEDDRAFPDPHREIGRFAPRGPVVVYDERERGQRFDHPVYGGPDGSYRQSGYAEGQDYDDRGPVGFPRYGVPPHVGEGMARVAPGYRAVAMTGGEMFDERAGLPDVGCTIQQSQSVTPAGWRKIVTHRTCYRR